MTANQKTAWKPAGVGALALLAIAAPAMASESTPSLLWSHTLNGETFTDYSVAIGNHGTEIVSDTGLFTRYTRLYSVSDSAGAPVWQASSSSDGYEHRVDSSRVDNFHVVCRQEPNASLTRDVVVEGYNSDSLTNSASWSYQFPQTVNGGDVNFCQVSADGQEVYAALKTSSGVQVVVIDPNSTGQATPTTQYLLPFTSSLAHLQFSDDGSRAYLANSLYSKVYNTNTQTLMFDQIVFGGGSVGHSFAGDGKTLAFAKNAGVQVHRENGGAYSMVQEFMPFGTDSTYVVGPTALSNDGSILVATYFEVPAVRVAHVFAWNVNTGQQLLHDVQASTSASYQNKASSVAFSKSETSRFVVGFWGDSWTGGVPEIVVYDRPTTTSNFTIHIPFERPGSVRELDISLDGTRLATSGVDDHINTSSASKVVEAFDLGTQIRVRDVPRFGHTVHVDYYIPANRVGMIIDSPALSTPPVVFGIGTLYLERATTKRHFVGSPDASGRATFSYDLSPLSLGETRFFQGVEISPSGPPKLSEDWTSLTVLP